MTTEAAGREQTNTWKVASALAHKHVFLGANQQHNERKA